MVCFECIMMISRNYLINNIILKEMVIVAKFQPVIKWSGSKRSQAENIVNKFQKILIHIMNLFVVDVVF